MNEQILINVTPQETRVAVTEQGAVQELHVERDSSRGIVGNIYLGRVCRVLPGMQSAFVEIGLARAAFLHVADIWLAKNGDGPVKPIEKILSEGQALLVQVVKDPIGTKGPRLSRHLSFPGRFLVYMPGIDHIGISRKITDTAERERLRTLIRQHAGPNEGFIVRTAAIGEKDEDLVSDVTMLRDLWKEVQVAAEATPAPGLVWQDLRLLHKVLRDMFREEVASFWVDDPSVYGEVRGIIQKLHPDWADRVKPFTSDLPIFEAFGIEQEIEAARSPKVHLRHGGSIVLNQTEALVSVDVNTGRYVGKKDLEETVFHTNMEAIPEIVRQLRLRNLGGIIVVDFIDMLLPEHRDAVMARLQEELQRDRNHARASSLSEFGLVEMTRKRTGPNLERQLTAACPACGGSGRLPSADTILLKAYREMVRLGERLRGATVRLSVHPETAAGLHGEAREGLLDLARALGAKVAWIERAEIARHTVAMDLES